MEKTDRSVVRNLPYQKSSIGIRERHNERKNECYANPDIQLERSHMNVHFRKCESTYTQALDRMIADGTVSTRGLKADAKMFGEMVFDVNSAYFDERGGYDYAKRFFEDAFHFAEMQVGSQFILSAVMHADERNRALSEERGRDIYHYHLHVVYIPVVEKEVLWTKRCKDKALVGTVKEVIHQISHSKKWALIPIFDECGAPILTKSGSQKKISPYSILQDNFFEYMQDAGYTGFERGVRGSTEENLSTLEYKIKQDTERLAAINEKITRQQAELGGLDSKIKSATAVKSELYSVESIGKKKMFGKVELTEKEYTDLTALAKEGIASRSIIDNLHRQINDWRRKYLELSARFNELVEASKAFFEAMRRAPEKVKAFISEILGRRRVAVEQEQSKWRVKIGGHDAR